MGWFLYPGCDALRAYNIFLKDDKPEQIAAADSKSYAPFVVTKNSLYYGYATSLIQPLKLQISSGNSI